MLFVAAVVVVVAQGDEVAEVRGSTVFPMADVMELAHGDGGSAVSDRAGRVESFDGPVLGRSGEALGATNV